MNKKAHDAKMAAVRKGKAAAPKRVGLFARRAKPTGLGAHEKAVVELLAGELLDNLPEELRDAGLVSLDVWQDTLQGIELCDALPDFPDSLDRRAWSPEQERSIKTAVDHELRRRGIHTVATRQDLVHVLASRRQLHEDALRALPEIKARLESIEAARSYADRGHATYTIQADGLVVPGLHPGESYLALRRPEP